MSVASLFANLIQKKTTDEVLAEYIVALKAVGFPAMSWHSTSVPIRLLTAMAGTHAKFTELLDSVTRGGYLELATGNWLTLLALSLYQITRHSASSTQLHGSIADVASAGPFSVTVGQLRFATASGKIFTNDAAFTITLDSAADFTMTAAAAGATYNVGTDEVVRLLTPLPGTGFAVHTPVRTTGASPPTVTPSGTAAANYDFAIEITTGGALGVAVFKWSDDGGGTWTTGVTVPGGGTWVQYGVTVTFAAGTYTTDHSYRWASGCVSFNPRTDCIASTGTDEESDELVRQRCRDQWATLGYGANSDWYRYYCRNTPTYGANVTRVKVDTASVGTGVITLTLAGPSGAVDGTTLAAVDAYMQAIKPEGVTVNTNNAVEEDIIPVGNAYVFADYIATAQGSMEDELDTYLGGVDIGGTVYLSQVVDSLQYDGDEVRNCVLSSPTTDTVLASNGVPKRGSFAGLVINSV